MMRAFFITACALSLIYFCVACYFTAEVDEYNSMWLYDYDYGSYNSYDYDYSYDDYGYSDSDYWDDMADDATRLGGFFTLAYMLMSATAFLLALLKIKTTTMKVISIIGLSLAGIFILVSFIPIANPGGADFEEVGPLFALATIALLGLHIVGMIQSFRTKT